METNNKHIRVILTKEQAHSGKFEIEYPIDAYDFINYYPKTRQAELPVVDGGTAIVKLVPKQMEESKKSEEPPAPQPPEKPTVVNNIIVKGSTDNTLSKNTVLVTIPVKGKVGETVRVGDFITQDVLGRHTLSQDGLTLYFNGDQSLDYRIDITPSLKDYMYTLKEDGSEFSIQSMHTEELH